VVKNKSSLLFAFFLSVLFYACSDAPTEIGADLLPPGDGLELFSWNTLDTPVPQTSWYKVDTVSMNYASAVLLGEVQNDVKSHLLLKFLVIDQVPDSIKDALSNDSLSVTDAWISAPVIYRYGDGAELDFSVHGITDKWSALNFTIDSLNNLSFNETDDYVSQEVTDSTFEFHFTPTSVYDWLMSEVVDSIDNYGLYLRPEGGDLVLGFPALTTTLTNSRMKLTCVVEKPNDFVDTLVFYTSADVHVVEREIPDSLSGKIILSAGKITRGFVKFDLTEFPKNVAINRAIMRVFIDETETLQGSNPSDTLYFTMLADSSGGVAEFSPKVLATGDSSRISANITEFVQKWINHPEQNYGVRLNLTDEKTSVNKLVFYGSEYPDTVKRPYLEIVYTKMN
jgi:hypothetical protein